MKYRIEEYKLKNGIEDISIIFDEKYQLYSGSVVKTKI